MTFEGKFNGTKTAEQPTDEGPTVAPGGLAASEVPEYYVPPVLGFDELYLNPTKLWDETITAHKEAFLEQRLYYGGKAARERSQQLQADQLAAEADARAKKLAADAHATSEETRRQNELHSQAVMAKDRRIAYLEGDVTTLKAKVKAFQDQCTDLIAMSAKERSRAEARLAEFRSDATTTAWILCLVVGGIASYAGYSVGHNSEVLAQNSTLEEAVKKLQSERSAWEAKNASLVKQVEALTPKVLPSPPFKVAEEAISDAYESIDAAYNSEDVDKLFGCYAPDFNLETHGTVESLETVKASIGKAAFRPEVLHQQTTQISYYEPGVETNPPGLSFVEVIDDDTVKVSLTRTLMEWEQRYVTGPYGHSDFKAVGREFCLVMTDTWRRVNGKWLLSLSDVETISEKGTNKVPPPVRCSKFSCGEVYTRGVGNPFDGQNFAIKRCPVCGGFLHVGW